MKALQAGLLFVLLAFAAALPAAEPVAVRVEVAPLGAGEGGSRVAVLVRVAPEDRGRIGRNAMVRIELDGEPPPGQSPLWAVRMADDGSARIETVWPPGEHRLELEIASPSGTERGLWVGTVRIPGVLERGTEEEGAAAIAPPSEQPAPEPATPAAQAAAPAPPEAPPAMEGAPGVGEAAPPAVVAAAEPAAFEPAAEPVAAADDALPVGGEPAVAATLAPVVAAAEIVETLPAVEPAPAAAEIAAATEAPSAEPSVVPEAAASEPTSDQPSSAPAAAVSAAAAGAALAAEAGSPGAGPDPGPGSEPAALEVEPLRAAEPQPAMGEAPAPAETPAPPAAAAPPAPDPAVSAAAVAAWAAADPASVELTAVALADREPVPGLGPADLRLRVAGAEVPIEAVGGAGNAPLLLGIAVDAAPESGIGWPGAGGPLGVLAARAAQGRGSIFYASPGSAPGSWGAGPPAAASAAGDLASLVAASLERFAGTRGRRFLLLVTDGRSEPDKTAWQSAVDAAAASGTPVLVVALWDERFSQRTRKQLRELAEVSGGSLFLVQGSSQLERAAERFGPLLDAGVSVRFRVPSGVALPAELRLEGARQGLEVTTARKIGNEQSSAHSPDG